jgi:prepilin-type N-terminal cleavage/methylation domain-containing protein
MWPVHRPAGGIRGVRPARLRRRRPVGFTVIEILIAMAVGLVLLLGVYVVFDSSTATYARSTNRQDTQQAARHAMVELTRQIRTAGFFPENFPAPGQPLTPPANAFPVHIAAQNALALYGDLDGSGTSVVWLYCLNASQQLIAKKGAANAPAGADYTCTGDDWILAENVTGLIFSYFDGSDALLVGAGAAKALDGEDLSGGMPDFGHSFAQRSSIRKIVITLQVAKPVPEQTPQQSTLTTTIRPRNLAS